MRVFNEDTRVKLPATIHFLRLGYEYQSLADAIIDPETKVFRTLFKQALERLNQVSLTEEQVSNELSELRTLMKQNDLGKGVYRRLTKPYSEELKWIDFENIEANRFHVVNELPFGDLNDQTFRPDVTVLINGLPLAFLEVKKPNNEGGIQAEFNRMINKRLNQPKFEPFFNLLQFVTFSNNMEYEEDGDDENPKAGSFYTTPNGFQTSFSFFREEEPKTEGFLTISDLKMKEILKDNNYDPSISDSAEFQTNLELNTPCHRFITSFFEKERLMFFLKYGIMYVDEKTLQKHVMRYPQFFASRQIIKRLEANGKNGIVWHTQGSGKTALAAFSSRLISDYYAKQGVLTRFFFVVDRLDLLNQSSQEFENRGFDVLKVKNRQAFATELNKVLTVPKKMDANGAFTVVNVQKFMGEIPQAKNDYNGKIQRIFFIDEAHRSYASNGEYYKNLMTVDDEAIFIALTGTPLLSKKERSNLKFGDYIHKYFYDKSIADGYTLRIKKESIDTKARAIIHRDLNLESPEVDKKAVLESDAYIRSLGQFIQQDFEDFRYKNNDKTIGGMIVCSSNLQAKKVHAWFEEHSTLKTGLVITDESIPTQVNKETQEAFKYTLCPDLLVVHQMLTTGYDVKRLKKMYLLRNAKEHSLLQTISRVNRPYKNPDGKVYHYGYITDFVDIEKQYDQAIENYLVELAESLGETEETQSLRGLILGPEEIYQKFQHAQTELQGMVTLENAELFSRALTTMTKEELYQVRRLFHKMKDCYIELQLSKATERVQQIPHAHYRQLTKEVENRIKFLNAKEKPIDTFNLLSNQEVVQILYDFILIRIQILDLSKFEINPITDIVTEIQKETKRNQNTQDPRIVKLNEWLQALFARLEIIATVEEFHEVESELKEILAELKAINEENEQLAATYGGNYAFVRLYHLYQTKQPHIPVEDLRALTFGLYEAIQTISLDSTTLWLQGRKTFVASMKQLMTKHLIRTQRECYLAYKVSTWSEEWLNDLYQLLQLTKSN